MIRTPIPSLDGLTTGRLRFRALTLADKPAWMSFINSEEAMRFIGFPAREEAVCDEWFERQFQRYTTTGAGHHAVVDIGTGELIGQCGLLVQSLNDAPELEIGYHLLPSAWGHGYATEAARACHAFARTHLLADSIISIVHVDNVRSANVAQRNGMTLDKTTTFRDLPVNIFRALLNGG